MADSEKKPKKSPVAEKEEEILNFWKENGIFKKTLEKASPKGEFVFYDGPPFATGLPHYGHILPGTIKDVIPRFKTMQGFRVPRRWGWDCHGLPIENIVEKELDLKTKKDILELGIKRFNKEARSRIMRYADDWKRIIPRTGRWVDMEHDYKTMDTSYTESVWWAFSELHKKGLVYEDFKVMHVCPRCETTLSNFEVNQGYKDVTDISVYAKFEIKGKPKTYLVAWTTTPWTLPGNVALAVNPDVEYVKIKIEDPTSQNEGEYILAKARLGVVKEKYEVLETFKGKKLLGVAYNPPFDYYKDAELSNKDRAWKVYAGKFVTIEDGSGIVHIAPSFGSDDYELSKKEKLPSIQHVSFDGKFKPEVSDFAGKFAKPKENPQEIDIEIIRYLAYRKLLLAKEKITHSYPHCWRCDTPLLNYATSSWFVKVTSLKSKLLKENQKINWIPDHVKEGRFGKWLEGARDWAISRSRFWGAPLPVWRCEKCRKIEVVGSLSKLREKARSSNEYYVMRHGEAKSNVLGIISSDQNMYGLTHEGEKMVEERIPEIRKINPDVIIVSPFKRTKQTALIVKHALGLPDSALVIESRIHEINAGVFNGKPIMDYRNYASHHDRFHQAPPDGESQLEVKKRMGEFLYGLEKKYSGKKILIVTHDSPAWLLFAAADGLGKEETYKLHDNKKFFLGNAEIRKLSFSPLPHNDEYEVDLHRPYIDDVAFSCSCGGSMNRIPEIFDTWFDSGSMPYAQFHYPFENKDKFDPSGGLFSKTKGFPADFIAEGLDQTRGWFYTLIVLSTALFGHAPYKNVIVNGLILGEDGRKMSKRLKNYPDPMDVIDRYGADALRLYMMGSPLVHAEEVVISEKEIDEVYKKNILRLLNVVSFFEMYAGSPEEEAKAPSTKNVLDEWIVTRLHETLQLVTQNLESLNLDKAVFPIVDFIDDLSTWYVRRSRDRFKGEGEDKEASLKTTQYVLLTLSKILAPFAPFIAEDIYRKAGGEKESVHLESWPQSREISAPSISLMKEIRKLSSLGLEARSKAKMNVRQPLSVLNVLLSEANKELKEREGYLKLLKDEVNVKEVHFTETLEGEVELDSELTPELKEEGAIREVIRAIQDMRKKNNLSPKQTINLKIDTNEKGKEFLFKNQLEIKKATGVGTIEYGTLAFYDEVKFDDVLLKFAILPL